MSKTLRTGLDGLMAEADMRIVDGYFAGQRGGKISGAVATVAQAVMQGVQALATVAGGWMAAKRAANELAALDDRLLQDIGINRADIEEAVSGRFQPNCYAHNGNEPVQLNRYRSAA